MPVSRQSLQCKYTTKDYLVKIIFAINVVFGLTRYGQPGEEPAFGVALWKQFAELALWRRAYLTRKYPSVTAIFLSFLLLPAVK